MTPKNKPTKADIQSAASEHFRELTGDVDVRKESVVQPTRTSVEIQFVADPITRTVDIRFPQPITGLRLDESHCERLVQDILRMLQEIRQPGLRK